MLHRLALGLGRTLGELDAALTEHELADWAAYYELEPWGYEMENFRHALHTLTMVRMQTGKKGGRFKLQDFMRQPPVKPRVTKHSVLAALASAGVQVVDGPR